VIAYKIAEAADVGTSYKISLGTSRGVAARIVDYVGVETSSPFENSFGAGNPTGGGSTTTLSYPSVTTTVNKSMVVFGGVAFHAGSAATVTSPAGTTQRVHASTSSNSPYLTIDNSDLLQETKGTVTKSGTISPTSAWGAVTLALKPGAGSLQFDVAPSVPTLSAVTLKGEAQTTHATMSEFAVDDTNTESGWNVTVNGNSNTGKSAVFKQYCENGASACGATPAHSYVSGGQTLPAGSLQLSTSGASWSTNGGAGSAPAFQCNSSSCSMDSASATKIVSAAAKAGLGPWSASGFSASSISLLTPSTTRTLPEHEIYHVDLVWTLSSGP